MSLSDLPPDILLNVCLFLPIYVLKDFYDHLPIGKWKILVEKSLFQNVFYGPALQGEYRYNITLEELVQFAKGELTTRIRSLHLFLQDHLFEAPCIDAFLAFAKRYPDFLSLIPSIKYFGNVNPFQKYSRTVSIRNVVWCVFFNNDSVLLDLIPPKLVKLYVSCDTFDLSFDFPVTLKKLSVRCISNMGRLNLPPNLEDLKCDSAEQIWEEFPITLKELTLVRNMTPFAYTFPENLTNLTIDVVLSINLTEIVFPLRLRRLCFSNIFRKLTFVGEITFPVTLEVLEITDCVISCLSDFKFPMALQKLNLNDSLLTSLDNVDFPLLKYLNISAEISRDRITSMRKAQLPWTLETLIATGQPIEDWSRTILPDNLKTMDIMVAESNNLPYPPCLEVLKVVFKSHRANFRDLSLPYSLVDLSLENGECLLFHWNLPNLKKLSASQFYGEIHIPRTVTDLYLRGPHQRPFYRLKLPFGLESVNLSFLAKRYPGTLGAISISKYTNNKEVQWPPRLRWLEINSNDSIDRALLKLPPSVRFLRGTNIRD